MTERILYIGNKNYSSWSLRPWLVLKHAGLAFEEVLIPLDQGDWKGEIRRHSPSGKVPCLKIGEAICWDSLAIAEWVHELAPHAKLWPEDAAARAVARSVSAEMHAGFATLRQAMPMNIRGTHPGKGMGAAVQTDINRITALWRDCRRRYAGHKKFLFGDFTIADAMYAPVVTRFVTYGVSLDDSARDYVQTVLADPHMQEWIAAAKAEPWTIPSSEL